MSYLPVSDLVDRIILGYSAVLWSWLISFLLYQSISSHQASVIIVISPTPCLNDQCRCPRCIQEATEKVTRALFYMPSFPYEEKSYLFCMAAFSIYYFKSKDRWEEPWGRILRRISIYFWRASAGKHLSGMK